MTRSRRVSFGIVLAFLAASGLSLASEKAPPKPKASALVQGGKAPSGQKAALMPNHKARLFAADKVVSRNAQRLAPLLRPSLDPSGKEGPTLQKEIDACVAKEDPLPCIDSLAKHVREKRERVDSAKVDLAVEASRLRQEFGMEAPADPDPAAAPEDLSFSWTASEISGSAAPLGNVARSTTLENLSLLSSEVHAAGRTYLLRSRL